MEGVPPPTTAFDGEALHRAVRRGGAAVFLAQLVSQLLSLVVLAILLRTLGPEPYGLLGMVLPLLAFVRIFIYSGLDVAAIQQTDLDPDQASALFWMQQILGGLGAIFIACCAPWVSRFYDRSELWGITLALACSTFATTLGLQHQALLQRKMDLVSLSSMRVAAQLVGGVVSVVAALAGAGVWTLVLLQYVEPLTMTLLAWWTTGWRPRLVLRRTGARELLRFGGYYTVSSVLIFLIANVDKVLVGRFLGTNALALYGQAFNLAQKPVGLVVGPLTGVMLPTLSHAKTDPERFRDYVAGFIRFLAWSMLPCGVGLALVARETMSVLGGSRWEPAGPILQVFALMIPAQAFFNAMGSVYSAVGRADRMAQACLPVALLTTATFYLTLNLLPQEPQTALILAWVYLVVFGCVLVPLYVAWAFQITGVPLRVLFAASRIALYGTLFMTGVVVLGDATLRVIGITSPWIVLPIKLALGIAAYFSTTRKDLHYYLKEGLAGLRHHPAKIPESRS